MWLMLQQRSMITWWPRGNAFGSELDTAFALVGLIGGSTCVSARYVRPNEVDALCGDASKAQKFSAGNRRCPSQTSADHVEDDLAHRGLSPARVLSHHAYGGGRVIDIPESRFMVTGGGGFLW
jgi:hypothetical protein